MPGRINTGVLVMFQLLMMFFRRPLFWKNMDIQSLNDLCPALPGLDLTAEQAAGMASDISTMGEFSAARFFEQNPVAYKLISHCIEECLSDAAIVRIVGCHHRTVAAIRRREVASLSAAEYRRAAGSRARDVVIRATDELSDRLSSEVKRAEMTEKDLVQMIDKVGNQERLLAGEPTDITGVLHSAGAMEDIREMMQSGGAIHSGGKSRALREVGAARVVGDASDMVESDGSDKTDLHTDV